MRSAARFSWVVPVFFLLSCSKEAGPPAPVGPAPANFQVKLGTSKGDVLLDIHKDWAPKGVERFWELIHNGFYDSARFFRVLPNFVVQWGINGNPQSQRLWVNAMIPDDPVTQTNRKGTITYAMRGAGTRTTQVFINLRDNPQLDKTGFAPFGEVTGGMDVVEKLYAGYGEGAPRGNGPSQDLIQTQGNEYLERSFPRLDYIKKARVQK
ncbi:MAG: peptidylprolyl isomerase [Acidobacteria bacterium]|nr:peptidylprolyl isomerase [Acidobacteriota bacterium]MBI3471076.1 peptidylprolyl isomerase [Candidatus Solibacter usitatus]